MTEEGREHTRRGGNETKTDRKSQENKKTETEFETKGVTRRRERKLRKAEVGQDRDKRDKGRLE